MPARSIILANWFACVPACTSTIVRVSLTSLKDITPPPPELFELSKWKVISQTNPLYSFFLKWCWGWGWEGGGGGWNLLWMMQWTFIDKKIQTNLTKNLVLIQETLPSSQHRCTSWIFNAVNFLAFLTAY